MRTPHSDPCFRPLFLVVFWLHLHLSFNCYCWTSITMKSEKIEQLYINLLKIQSYKILIGFAAAIHNPVRFVCLYSPKTLH